MKITVKVKPNSKQQKIVKSNDSNWVISIKSSQIDGKATQELIQLLAKKFQVSKTTCN